MNSNMFLSIIYGFIAILCNIVSFNSGHNDHALNIIGYSSTVVLLSFLLIDYKINKRFTYSALFVLILFLFHFGQLMLLTFFSKSYDHIRFMMLLDTDESLYGFRIMTASMSALCFGSLLKSAGHTKMNQKGLQYNIDWIKFSKRIIFATFFVKLGLDVATLYISIISGGQAARLFVNSFPNILLFYGKISLLGFAILLVALKYKPKKQFKLFVFIVGYILIMMVSGIRSENVGYLAIFLFVYLQSRLKPFNVRQFAIYGVIGFFALTFIVAVGQFRNYSDKSLDTFLELTGDLLTQENVLFSLMDTCGDTGYTAQETLNEYLPLYGPSYGDAYYKGVAAVIPNLLPFIVDVGKITAESSTPIKLQKSGVLNSSYENIGGSFFAEQYMNFGVIGGVLVCFLWGLFFGWVGKSSAIAFKTDNVYQLIIMIPIMLASVYWVRSYFGGGIRETAWDIIFAMFILKRMLKSCRR